MSATRAHSYLWCILLAATLSVAQQSKPNLVFMLVDDWGWANVGYHCNPPTNEVVTPNIDGLVKEGLELDQHYAYQFCSPSRSNLLSGRLPIHRGTSMMPTSALTLTTQRTQFLDLLAYLET